MTGNFKKDKIRELRVEVFLGANNPQEQFLRSKYPAFLILFFLYLSIANVSFYSCTAGTSGSGTGTSIGSAPPSVAPTEVASTGEETGTTYAAGPPERPPSTTSLDPDCEPGAKPTERCKGSPLPSPYRPCPSNLTVVKDAGAGIWWCGCPEGSREVQRGQDRSSRSCVCPSGEFLVVNIDTGESLGCPMRRGENQNNSNEEEIPQVEGGGQVVHAPPPPQGPPCNPPMEGCYIIQYGDDQVGRKPVCYCPDAARNDADGSKQRARFKSSPSELLQLDTERLKRSSLPLD